MKPEGIVEELSGAVANARGLLSNLLDLFGLEARRAGLTLVLMLACAAAGAMLLVAAWISLMAALALGSAARGISWEAAFAAVAIATLLAALAVCWVGVRASHGLSFPATRRQLRPKLEAV